MSESVNVNSWTKAWAMGREYVAYREAESLEERGRRLAFVEALETAACEQVNRTEFTRDGGFHYYYPDLNRRRLRLQNNSRPYSLARRIIWWLLFNHPETEQYYSGLLIAQEYSRDHTTVRFALKSLSGDILDWRWPAELVQNVCDELAVQGFLSFDIREAAK